MSGFWQNKTAHQNIAFYTLSPFLEEAGRLLLTASRLYHPWSKRRQAELTSIGRALHDLAKTNRERAFGWSYDLPHLRVGEGYPPTGIAHYWYYGHDGTYTPTPGIVPYLVSDALSILHKVWPVYLGVAEKDWSTKGRDSGIASWIETLEESPYRRLENGKVPEKATDEMIRLLCIKGALHECSGLAASYALCEDRYAREQERFGAQKRQRRQSRFSPEQTAELAEKIGVDFTTLHDVFTTESSPWWAQSSGYSLHAQSLRSVFAEEAGFADDEIPPLLTAWESGSANNNEGMEVHGEDGLDTTRKVVEFFIANFRILIDQNGGEAYLTPPEQKLLATL